MEAESKIEELTIEATVIRCGCGDPDSHNGIKGIEAPCPRPRAIEDLGLISGGN